MLADYLVQFSPESALLEMSSSSANAFPAISRAVFVFPSSLASFSFRASSLAESAFSFLFSARSRASSSGSASLTRLPAEEASVPFSCCFRQLLDMGVVKLLLPHQRAALGAAFRQRVIDRQDPRLIRRGERPPGRPGKASRWSPDHAPPSWRPGQQGSSSQSRSSCLALQNLKRTHTSRVSQQSDERDARARKMPG